MSLPFLDVHPPVRRLRPVPLLEPPYDEDSDEPRPRPRLRLVVETPLTLPFDEPEPVADPDYFGTLPTPRSELPDPHRWSGRLVQAVYEVLAGRRPLQQLMPWTDERVYLQVTGRLRRQRAVAISPARLTSVHVSEPRDGVAEACAVVRQGPRSTAVALRLEGADGRWRCTALHLG